MPFPRKLLHQDEELVLDLRPHWIAMAPASLGLAIAVGVGLIVALKGSDNGLGTALSILALVLVVLSLGFFLIRLAGWMTTNFVLTSDRVITRKGVLTKSGIEIPLERINTVFFNQRLIERMLGSGDLGIESAGERGTESLSNIRRPAIVQREIYVQMEDNENRKFDRIGKVGTELTPVEQVERLSDLLDRGAISRQQFEAEKARILGS